jgi:hypothetical protein
MPMQENSIRYVPYGNVVTPEGFLIVIDTFTGNAHAVYPPSMKNRITPPLNREEDPVKE